MVKAKVKKEDGFEKLARLIHEEGEEMRAELVAVAARLEAKIDKKADAREMDKGFAEMKKCFPSIPAASCVVSAENTGIFCWS